MAGDPSGLDGPPRPVPFSKVAPFVGRYKWLLAEIALIAIVLRLLALVEPFAFQAVIDRVLPFERQQTLAVIAVVLLMVALFDAALGAVSFYLSLHTGNRIASDLGNELYGHTLRLPLTFLQRWPVGELLARVGEVGAVSGFLSGTIMTVALDLLFALVYLAILFALSPTLTLVILALLPIQALLFLAFGPVLRRRLQDQFLAGSAQSAQLVESLGGVVTIKALAAEAPVRARMMAALEGTLHQSMRVGAIQNWSGALEGIFQRVVTIAILVIGSRLIFAGDLTLGQLIAFYLLSDRVAGPLLSIAGLWEAWQGLTVSRIRLGEVWNEAAEAEGRPALTARRGDALAFEGVRFAYPDGAPVVTDLAFTAAAGRPFLIVGPSGAGKSTIGKLASGLYVPDAGRAMLGGHDLARHDPVSVRRAIGYVPQDALLFDGTIRENLLIAVPDASEIDVAQALDLADAAELVAQFPDGLDTQVGERGGRLSGGQRQRLALARALLADPVALVLDEPTSALDPAAQDRVVGTLERLARDRAVIVITHRADLFGDAPRLAVMAMPEEGAA